MRSTTDFSTASKSQCGPEVLCRKKYTGRVCVSPPEAIFLFVRALPSTLGIKVVARMTIRGDGEVASRGFQI
jgi:hypothetical protein